MNLPCWAATHGPAFVPAVGPKAQVVDLIIEAVEGIESPEAVAERILDYLERDHGLERP